MRGIEGKHSKEKNAIFLLLVGAAISARCIANPVAPPSPVITVNAMIDGAPVPDNTTALLYCYMGATPDLGGSPDASYYFNSGIADGVVPFYSHCREGGNATFVISNPSFGRNYSARSPMALMGGFHYIFNISISSVSGNVGIIGESVSDTDGNYPCMVPLVLCFGAFAVACARIIGSFR